MPILASDVKWKKSESMNDTPNNGGRMTQEEIPSGVKNNLFPDVPKAERDAGSVKYRKVFIDVGNIDNLAMITPQVFVAEPTPGQDGVHILPATFNDTQVDIDASYREYACGVLTANILPGDTTITVDLDIADVEPFQPGDTIRISDMPSIDSTSGKEEMHTIADVTYTATHATITLQNPTDAPFLATETKVSNLLGGANLQAGIANLVNSSVNGVFEPLELEIKSYGAIQQTISLTFNTETSYTVTGDVSGTIGNGTTGSDFQPLNPSTSTEIMILSAQAWSGTFTPGDTITFDVIPAAFPIWYKRIVPAGADQIGGNEVVVGLIGESF